MPFRTISRSFAGLFFCIALCNLAIAEPHKAGDFYKLGQRAEAAGDCIAAFADYARAHQTKSEDLRYRTSWERLRPLAASTYLHQG